MSLFSFLKDAGAKVFGHSDSSAEKSRKVAQHIYDLSIPGADHIRVECDADGKATLTGECKNQQIKEKVLVAAGNIEGVSEIDDQLMVLEEDDASTFYTVKAGDTLSKIAQEVYGDANKYPKIFEANKPMLTNPDKIYPGQTLIIPKDAT